MTKLTKLDISNIMINMIVFMFAALCLLILFIISKKTGTVPQEATPWLLGAGVSILICMIVTLEALKTAPNPGYVTAIETSSTVIVTLISVVLLASTLTVIKWIGIVITLTGISILCFF